MARSDLIDLTALIGRGGQVMMRMLPNVRRRTIEPIQNVIVVPADGPICSAAGTMA